MARSIRFRLTAWYALALCGALGLFSALIWLSLRQRLLAEIDQDLVARAGQFERYVRREAAEVPQVQLRDEMEEFCQALPSSSYLALHGASGLEFHCPEGRPSMAGKTAVIERQFAVGGESFHLRIISSLATVDHTLALLQYLLFSLVPLVAAIACAGGAWLSRRALKPVDEITTAAGSIGINNLSQRLPSPETGDELQRLTEVWNTMLARLENAVATLSQFAADASHELRTPLSVIRTSAELALRRARDPEAYRASLQEISEEAGLMTRLVEDLMFLARNEAQSAEMPKEPLDLRVVVADATAELRRVAELRRICVTGPRPPGDHPACVLGNRVALRRLFLVLLDNAIKYSHADSEVLVGIASRNGRIAVTIEDFGIGIDNAEQAHIFKRFYQADKARTDGGFGLGLSLADSIAREHRATIDVESQPGTGSRFSVVFTEASA